MPYEKEYIEILKQELVPAMGCTEPIAIAYAAAKAREILEGEPESLEVGCSGNIIKNVQGVIIPNTGNLRGIKTAAIAGAMFGDASRKLEVLASVQKEDLKSISELSKSGVCREYRLNVDDPLAIDVTAKRGDDAVLVKLRGSHTNITFISKNGNVLLENTAVGEKVNNIPVDRACLSIKGILDFANTVDIDKIKPILEPQVKYNLEIAEEGLANDYGASVGKTLLEFYGDNVFCRASAYAAAGSDARMSGCDMPVVINSGSGNQGLTVSLPVIIYARSKGIDEEKLYRALAISNLVALHNKSMIGRLSAFCGAVSAASGAGAAITFLCGGDERTIELTITNALGTAAGMVCDGAKPSCAAKIAAALEAALTGHCMAMKGRGFGGGEGLVMGDMESTLQSVGRMARIGMKQTDIEILRIMVNEND